jgi:hypothetical protein
MSLVTKNLNNLTETPLFKNEGPPRSRQIFEILLSVKICAKSSSGMG